MRATAIIVTVLFAIGSQPVKGNEDAAKKLHGVWRLTSLKLQVVGDESQARDIFGSNPKGYLIFTAEGRMTAVVSAADRKPPTNDADNIALMKSFLAYTGKYAIEGDKWTTKVDVSWNEVYSAQDQVQFFKVDGDRLAVRTAERESGVFPGKKVVASLTWERER